MQKKVESKIYKLKKNICLTRSCPLKKIFKKLKKPTKNWNKKKRGEKQRQRDCS